jgi:predicted esterase
VQPWQKWTLVGLGVAGVGVLGWALLNEAQAATRSSACQRLGEFQYIEVASDGGSLDRELPLLVLLHGLGSRPQDMLAKLQAQPKPTRVVAIQGPLATANGRSWMLTTSKGNQDKFRAALADLGPKVGAWVEAFAACRPTSSVTVLGFSQGGHVALAAASRLVGVAGRVIATNSWMPADMFGPSIAPVTWLSGTKDTGVPHARSAETAGELVERGLPVTWIPISGAGHELTGTLLQRTREAAAAM